MLKIIVYLTIGGILVGVGRALRNESNQEIKVSDLALAVLWPVCFAAALGSVLTVYVIRKFYSSKP